MVKTLPWILFVLAFVGALFAFGLLLNAGSALEDARSQATHLRERSDIALSIIREQWVGKQASEVADLAADIERHGVIAKTTSDGSFEIGDFVFEIENGVVTQVRYFD